MKVKKSIIPQKRTSGSSAKELATIKTSTSLVFYSILLFLLCGPHSINGNETPWGKVSRVYCTQNRCTISGNGFPNATESIVIRLTVSPVDCNFHSIIDNDRQMIVSEPLNIIYRNETVILFNARNDTFFGQHPAPAAAYLCFSNAAADDDGNVRHMGLASQVLHQYQRSSRMTRDDVFRQVHNQPKILNDSRIAEHFKDDNQSLAPLKIVGFRVEASDKDPTLSDEGVPDITSQNHVTLRVFGTGLRENTVIVLTEEIHPYGHACLLPRTLAYRVTSGSITPNSALVDIVMPSGPDYFYICARYAEENGTDGHANTTIPFMHQGIDPWLRLSSHENVVPIWLAICIICTCLMFSALFSGLNLGLMSLDRTELKILKTTGTPNEKKHAAKIQPIRDHGNYLLCSILLGNVLVNSTFTILLDSLTSGVIAVVFSTLLIVIFGEITPQAICSRHGLAVGANTIFITKMVMILTFPLAYPTSKFLDYLLGEEIGNVYNRERLKELVRVTKDVNDLDKDEVNIISGALELRKKAVSQVMTHIEDAFMLPYDAILDFETVSEIMKSGFSRIPVYEGDRLNVCTLLYIKDLAFVDPDDNTPLRTLCEYYQNPCHFVFEDVTLDVMFKQFKEGLKGHMAFVNRVNSEGDGDPFYETIGLITLEDVIEELIQAEIMDETDVYTDNRTKVRRAKTKKQDFTIFAERRDNNRIRITPQLTLATFQYLTTMDAFKSDIISDTILRRLLNQDVVQHIKCKGKDKNDPSMIIYQQGKPADYFVLILEGRVEATVGRENLMFESGPFTYFGIQALVQNVGVDSPLQGSLQSLNMDAMLRHTFVPDYSVKAITEVFYVAIKRTLYLAAKRATLMERSQRLGELGSNEPIDDEVEKLLNSLDEDDRSIGAHTANLNANTPRALSKAPSNTPSPVHAEALVNPITHQNSLHSTISIEPHQHQQQPQQQQHKSPSKINVDDSEAPLLPLKKF